MTDKQRSADRAIEWAILVLELAGIVAIFVPFAYGVSPWRAVPVLAVSGQWILERSRALEIFVDITLPMAALAFFLAPLLSYAQLSRCLGRSLSQWQRTVLMASALLVAIGCLAMFALSVRSLIRDHEGARRDVVDFAAVFLVWMGLLVWALRSRRRLRRASEESLAMGVYIGGVTIWGLSYSSSLEPTAIIAGFTCVVYAVSLWRRMREGSE